MRQTPAESKWSSLSFYKGHISATSNPHHAIAAAHNWRGKSEFKASSDWLPSLYSSILCFILFFDFPSKNLGWARHRNTLYDQLFSWSIATLISWKIQIQKNTPSSLPVLNECVHFFKRSNAQFSVQTSNNPHDSKPDRDEKAIDTNRILDFSG